jgi:hypothetical protein
MKLLFLTITLICGLTAGAQTTAIEVPKEKIEELNRQLKGMVFSKPEDLHAYMDSLIGNNAGPLSTARVYNLPQDNMPCLVPDMNLVKKIPNVMTPRVPFKTEIPNAAPKQKLKPKN